MKWQNIKISSNNTHFLLDKNPVFRKLFINVLKFHSPGLAPVLDKSGAYHIDENGNELYKNRYSRVFGFYCNRASVIKNNHWFHINERGERVYSSSYVWTGNYQENICTVRDKKNQYYHIDLNGNRVYKYNTIYAGDYKNGVACVKLQNNLYKHIDINGEPLNNKCFLDLGVFHKNFATAKDENGWFHIDKCGHELYKERYMMIEPFYNGFALVNQFDLNQLIIDEKGQTIIEI